MSERARVVIVVGASAGGVPVLLELAGKLPSNFNAAVLIVLHVGVNPSLLPSLLRSRGPNPASHAADGERILAGHLYVAPPDRHLLIEDGLLRLSAGPKEHHTRPAIDPLFRSAALAYGERTIGVIVSGRFDDGTAGLQAIKACGGLAVVQDPDDAEEPSMPLSALQNVSIDRLVTSNKLADTLVELIANREEPIAATVDPVVRTEHDVSLNRGNPMHKLDTIGRPSNFTCPDCSGTLWEIRDAKPPRFRCHTGHAFTLRSLSHNQAIRSEDTVWAAIRGVQEQTNLLRRLADFHTEFGDAHRAGEYSRQLSELQKRTDALSQLLVEDKFVVSEEPSD